MSCTSDGGAAHGQKSLVGALAQASGFRWMVESSLRRGNAPGLYSRVCCQVLVEKIVTEMRRSRCDQVLQPVMGLGWFKEQIAVIVVVKVVV